MEPRKTFRDQMNFLRPRGSTRYQTLQRVIVRQPPHLDRIFTRVPVSIATPLVNQLTEREAPSVRMIGATPT
jgi:hypothetical protein